MATGARIKGVDIDADVLDVLRRSAVNGHLLTLPEQLPREVYVRVDKVLKALGAKWVRGLSAHKVPYGFDTALAQALAGGFAVDEKKTLSFWPTPPEVADRAVALLDLAPHAYHPDEPIRLLEPSAGSGALVEAVLRGYDEGGGVEFTLVEVSPARCEELQEKYGDANDLSAVVDCADFLLWPGGGEKFDRVLMNPPYDHTLWRRHVEHALSFVAPGGRLVAILPASAAYDAPLQAILDTLPGVERHTFDALPEGSFASTGTNVATTILTAYYRKAPMTTPKPKPAVQPLTTLKPATSANAAEIYAKTAARAKALLLRGIDGYAADSGVIFVGDVRAKALTDRVRYAADPQTFRRIAQGGLVALLLLIAPEAKKRGMNRTAAALRGWADAAAVDVYSPEGLKVDWPAYAAALRSDEKDKLAEGKIVDVEWMTTRLPAVRNAANEFAQAWRLLQRDSDTAWGILHAFVELGDAEADAATVDRFVAEFRGAVAIDDTAAIGTPSAITAVAASVVKHIAGLSAPTLSAHDAVAAARADAAARAVVEPTEDTAGVQRTPKEALLAIAKDASLRSRSARHHKDEHTAEFAQKVRDSANNGADAADPAAFLQRIVARLHQRLTDRQLPTAMIERWIDIAATVPAAPLDRFDLYVDGALVTSYTANNLASATAAAQGYKADGYTVELRRVVDVGAPAADIAEVAHAQVNSVVVGEAPRSLLWTTALSGDLATSQTGDTVEVAGYAFRGVHVLSDRTDEQIEAWFGAAEGVYTLTPAAFAEWAAEYDVVLPLDPTPHNVATEIGAEQAAAQIAGAYADARSPGVYGIGFDDATYVDNAALSAAHAQGRVFTTDPQGGDDLWFDGGVAEGWYRFTPVEAVLAGAEGGVYIVSGANAEDLLRSWGVVRVSEVPAILNGPEPEVDSAPPDRTVERLVAAFSEGGLAQQYATAEVVRLIDDAKFSVTSRAEGVVLTWRGNLGSVRVSLTSFGGGSVGVHATVNLGVLGFAFEHKAQTPVEVLMESNNATLFGATIDDAKALIDDRLAASSTSAEAVMRGLTEDIDETTGLPDDVLRSIEGSLGSVVAGAYNRLRLTIPYVDLREV